MMFFTRNANNSATLRNLHTVSSQLSSLFATAPHCFRSSGQRYSYRSQPSTHCHIEYYPSTNMGKKNRRNNKKEKEPIVRKAPGGLVRTRTLYEMVSVLSFRYIPMRSGNWNQSTAISKPTAMIQRKSFIFFMLLAPRMQPQPKVKKTMEVSATARFITTRESNS